MRRGTFRLPRLEKERVGVRIKNRLFVQAVHIHFVLSNFLYKISHFMNKKLIK